MAHRIAGDGPIKPGDRIRHTGTRQVGADGSQELGVETTEGGRKMSGPLSPFEAAEVAYNRAVASAETEGARRLETVLGGNGGWTAEVAYRQWCGTMAELGFGDYADDPNGPTPGNFHEPLDNDLHPGIE